MYTLIVLSILPLACMSCPEIIPRPAWKARPPANGAFQCMAVKSPNILIHHTYIPKICKTTEACKQSMNGMQRYHQETRSWSDIGYNFCIGGDGNVYEGRGWGVVGYPANGYEFNSTGICFIGDYTNSLPSDKMLKAAIDLIECGISKGFINKEPQVLGIREVIPTQSPGDKLQSYIEKTRFGYARYMEYENYVNIK
ncbi:UNVERIFIED_CONTAM: hypothetical protein PYX00_009648 [Menopon gallinae]|uniref:Peptidoglycan-recognition protein n=1 Tax=Menopon gallinae TaxID=328185 RepID=A0AAW2HCR5_9NEOP